MATEKNAKDMAQRKIHYDQISFLFPKGGRRLLRAMAIKERCTATDVIRQAILARAGLTRVPGETDLLKLDDAKTKKEAAETLIDCQASEYVKAELKKQGQPLPAVDDTIQMDSYKWYKAESLNALQTLLREIENMNAMKKPHAITLSEQDYNALMRLLSNVTVIEK